MAVPAGPPIFYISFCPTGVARSPDTSCRPLICQKSVIVSLRMADKLDTDVRFTAESGHFAVQPVMSALGQMRTHVLQQSTVSC